MTASRPGLFSRWLAGVIRDEELAGEVRDVERALENGLDLELLRRKLVALFERRYPEEGLEQTTRAG